ncbi:MAG TPA: dephospho-CoA kinase, partial [Thermoanaerobaculia bacterium]
MKPMLRVGLTGGLASGKSSVATILRGLGAVVFDADEIVKDLYAPGGAGAHAARELFGDAVLDTSGKIDRSLIAAIVFADPAKRHAL